MQYLLAFLEGIVTFVSPCLLPMLPVYLSYFAGQNEKSGEKAIRSALGFIAGFTVVFAVLGAFAGSVGAFLLRHKTAVNVITGAAVVLFGLGCMGLFSLPELRLVTGDGKNASRGFFSAMLFGVVFSLGWTPCVGAFLGTALLLASQQGTAAGGVLMLLCYSLGLGIPFLLSAVLIEQLTTAFSWIKRHYREVNLISGGLLVTMGILMMAGRLG